MRAIGLMIAGSLVAACGSTDQLSNAAPSGEVAGSNQAEVNQPAETQAEPAAPSTANIAQPASAGPCLMQGTERLQVAPIRAVGTEPFWGARIEGLCVTYSTPENQQGTRVWTRYSSPGSGRATWAGQLDGKAFEMRVRPQAGCSDGMSDKSYPMAVDLSVGGEQRHGCAEPL
jgi:uncharacterized membrane protein